MFSTSMRRRFFDFIDRDNESFRLIFESDLTNDPDVRERVNSVHQQCGEMIAELIHEETGVTATLREAHLAMEIVAEP